MNPKFSVIIPIYNVAPYLRQCLDSIVAQSCADWEAICVDDGSTDASGAILDEYARKDSRFRIFRQINSGVGAARNHGLEFAAGDWITYLDGDDFYTPWMLEEFVLCEKERPSATLLLVGLRVLLSRCSYQDEVRKNASRVVRDCREELPDCLLRGFCQYAYRRSSFGNIRFAAQKIGEDRHYLVECLACADEVVSSSSVGYIYRQRDGSAMRSEMTPQKIRDSLQSDFDTINVIVRSGKHAVFMHSILTSVLEFSGASVCRLPYGVGSELFEIWYEVLEKVSYLVPLTRVDRVRIGVLLHCRSRLAANLVARLPYSVKWHYSMLKERIKRIRAVNRIWAFYKGLYVRKVK